MIRNQWYVILTSNEVKKNQVMGVRRMGENLVVWRDSKGNLGAGTDKCPHRGIALSKGKVIDDHLQCPFHGFEYDQTGRCKLVPANGRSAKVPENIKMNAYPVEEANGYLYLWWGESSELSALKEKGDISARLPWFDDLDDSFSVSGLTDRWKAHYSRAIENQLDVVHVPVIHHNTIGRGIGPVVNGPFVKEFEGGLSYWPSNEYDRGQVPIRPDQMTEPPRKETYITFLFPNLWQNHIMDKLRIVVAFAPVDEENTLFYLRIYQKMVKISVIKSLYVVIMNIFNRIVLHQDRTVVETHQPQATSLMMSENLISGDYPIILYRKKRDELKKRNSTF
jgi:phenylpropionate dioxygenase-like ring-hydroxylating dioxygenase large terminal subunit